MDGKGEIRYRHYGEGEYVEIERVIQKLLKENGATGIGDDTVSVSGTGIEAAPSNDERSPETYVGYRQAENFASPEKVARDSRRTYTSPASPSLNQWGLVGSWNVGPEAAVLQAVPGKVVFRFHARDLNIILAPAKDGKPARFKLTLDGAVPGDNNGVDMGPDGNGEIREPRMYQLIRQKSFPIKDHTIEIEFLDPGAQVLDFTFDAERLQDVSLALAPAYAAGDRRERGGRNRASEGQFQSGWCGFSVGRREWRPNGDQSILAEGQAKLGVRRDLQKKLSVPSRMCQLTRLGAAERQAAEDKRPRMEGEFLFALVPLIAGELDGIELPKSAFRYRDGGKTRANCG